MGQRRMLLHACCGPCSIMPLELLAADGWDITLAYCNPNIHPDEEYAHRLEVLRDHAALVGVPVVELERDVQRWWDEVGCHGTDRPERCRACYRMRLELTAAHAVEHGFDAISSTLTVSPYQFTQTIAEELDRAAAKAGVEPVFRDFRPWYQEATDRSRAEGMYRQNYCGCSFSDEEAAAEREERRAQRRAEAQKRAEERAEREAALEPERARKREERARYDELQRRKRAVRDAIRAQARAERDGTDTGGPHEDR